MNELISIIVPIYNVEKYLERCIKSLISQTYKNIEIVLVNDGSPDNSEDICLRFKRQDNRIVYLKQKNAGLSAARNAGMKIAKGKYYMFVDSDDYVNVNFVKTLHDSLIENDADIAVCKYKVVYENSEIDINIVEKAQCKIFIGTDKYENFFNDLKTVTTVAWNKLYKKELFNNITYPVGKLHEDEYTTYKLFDISKKIVYIDCEYYYYFFREGSITQNYNPKRCDVLDALNEKMLFFKDNHLIKYYYLNLYDYYYQLIYNKNMLKKYYPDEKELINSIEIKILRNRNSLIFNSYINPFKKIKLLLMRLKIIKK